VIELTLKPGELERTMALAGDKFYPYVFAGLRRGFGAYRREFNSNKMGVRSAGVRGGKGGLKIRGQNRGGPPYAMFWSSFPKNEQQGRLDDIKVEIHTASVAAESLEFGAVYRPTSGRRYLTIPIGDAIGPSGRTRRTLSTPAKAKAAGFELRFVPRRGGRGPFLVAVSRTTENLRQLNRAGVQGPGPAVTRQLKGRAVFALITSATQRPALGLYKGWDAFAPERNKRQKLELDRYMKEHWGV